MREIKRETERQFKKLLEFETQLGIEVELFGNQFLVAAREMRGSGVTLYIVLPRSWTFGSDGKITDLAHYPNNTLFRLQAIHLEQDQIVEMQDEEDTHFTLTYKGIHQDQTPERNINLVQMSLASNTDIGRVTTLLGQDRSGIPLVKEMEKRTRRPVSTTISPA